MSSTKFVTLAPNRKRVVHSKYVIEKGKDPVELPDDVADYLIKGKQVVEVKPTSKK
jgi:hypothetical protein